MPLRYRELRPTNGRDRLAGLGHPSKSQQGSRLGFVTAATSLNRSQPNFVRCLAVCRASILYMPPNGILPGAKFTATKSCVLLFWQRCCTALEQWVSAKLCCMVQGMKLWNFCSSFSTEGATCIPTAAITFGIGPHSTVVMVALWNRADHYVFMLLSSFFSSPNLSRRRLDVCHTSTHGVALVRI